MEDKTGAKMLEHCEYIVNCHVQSRVVQEAKRNVFLQNGKHGIVKLLSNLCVACEQIMIIKT